MKYFHQKNNLTIRIVFVVALFLTACASEKPNVSDKPNVILIIADDHGINDIGVYGNPYIKTPAIDLLATSGTRFTSAFATTASCSPSRSVILTGLHNHTNGMYGLSHPPHNFSSLPNIKSLTGILSENGYRTGRIGKLHVGPNNVYPFDEALSDGAANDPASIGRSPVEMADLSIHFIKNQTNNPFFLLYATDDPHRSNVYTPEGALTFETYPEPNPFGNREEGFVGVTEVLYDIDEVVVPSYLPDNEITRKELAQYYQSISRMDQGIARLIEILKESGKFENTLIIYLSDNGPAFPASKATLYEAAIRLPFIVKAPNQITTDLVQNELISFTDIVPTVLDYAGIDYKNEDFHGISFRSLVENEEAKTREYIYGSHFLHDINMYNPMRMVRNHQYKLIYNIAYQLPFNLALDLIQSPSWISTEGSDMFGNRTKDALFNRPQYELYDIENDPEELNNLAYSESHKEIFQVLLQEIEKFQVDTNDPRLRLPVKQHMAGH